MSTEPIREADLTNKLLEMKFKHPMLGIMGAHLLLMAQEPDEHRVQNIIDRSFDLLGRDFQDAIALKIKLLNCFDSPSTPIDLEALAGPTMLKVGWDALKVARGRDNLVNLMTSKLDRLMRFEHKESYPFCQKRPGFTAWWKLQAMGHQRSKTPLAAIWLANRGPRTEAEGRLPQCVRLIDQHRSQ